MRLALLAAVLFISGCAYLASLIPAPVYPPPAPSATPYDPTAPPPGWPTDE